MQRLKGVRTAADDAEMTKVQRARKWFKRTAAGATLLMFLLLLSVAGGALGDATQADCIVIMGAAVRRNRTPSDALRYRLEEGLALYNQGRAPCIIVTGGGEGDYLEADVMAEWLEGHGVPPSAIIREAGAANTRDSGVLVAAIMRQRGLSTALVCSQWFHVARSRLCLAQEGITTHAAPCGGNTLVKEPLFVAREMIALPAYALRIDEWR